MVIVSSYWLARDLVQAERPGLVISLMDPGSTYSLPGLPTQTYHCRIDVHDVVAVQSELEHPYVVPREAHVRQIMEAADLWSPDRPALIHCGAGVSRSTAAALIFIVRRERDRLEHAARELRWTAPWAKPNPLMIELADQVLDLGGTLKTAVRAMGDPRTRTAVKPARLRCG